MLKQSVREMILIGCSTWIRSSYIISVLRESGEKIVSKTPGVHLLCMVCVSVRETSYPMTTTVYCHLLPSQTGAEGTHCTVGCSLYRVFKCNFLAQMKMM